MSSSALTPATTEHSKRRVSYYFDDSVGNYCYGQEHNMKPQRATMTNTLVTAYGLNENMQILRPWPCNDTDLTKFHDPDYVGFLISPVRKPAVPFNQNRKKYNLNSDNPMFDGLANFCKLYAGASLSCARLLNQRSADITINWMGGLHHAKKDQAYGFCYVNDIVLAIMELLKHHTRVLYVDIDVHHGDGVETAFYDTDRVMTVSFHQYDGEFFPETGELKDVGTGKGLNYAINVPLQPGITDDAYGRIFRSVMTKVMERYRPEAIVLQCGADSLTGDKIGGFNMTLRGHGDCVSFLRSYGLPLLLLGGGGYTPYNVARCWTHETALAIGKEIPNEIPSTPYNDHFSPSFQLHICKDEQIKDENTKEYLSTVLQTVLGNLEALTFAPSVQMQPIPDDEVLARFYARFNDECESMASDDVDSDQRLPNIILDGLVLHDGEFYDDIDSGRGSNVENILPPVVKRAREE